MICSETWPNPRSGGFREAAEAIIKAHNLQKDVTYGNTKIFIQSPETIFTLEEKREQMLPKLVTFLQKVQRNKEKSTF